MVAINRMRKDSTCVTACSFLDSHGVQAGAANARCNLGHSCSTSHCTPTL